MAPDAPLRRSSRIIASAALRSVHVAGASSKTANTARATVKSVEAQARRAIQTAAEAAPAKRAKVGRATVAAVRDVAEDYYVRVEVVAAKKVKGKGKDTAPVEYKPEDFPERVSLPWKVGPHVSVAGGVENAIINAASIGATAFALFVKSQRQWKAPDLKPESVTAFQKRLKQFGYDVNLILPHGNYLVNLGNPDAEKREKSFECFLDDLKRCEQLGLVLYNFHPGSTVGAAEPDTCLSHIAQCLNRAHKQTSHIVTVLENMAGSGNVLGSKFKELGKIISEVEDKSRVGVCLDTCHLFAAGYDLRSKESWEQTMAEFERDIGLKYLRGMHLNDSKAPLASHKDRHENIGMGHLGLSAFSHILSDPRTQGIPLIIETPVHDGWMPKRKNTPPGAGWDVWKKEVEVLHRLGEDNPVDETMLGDWAAEVRMVVTDKADASAKAKPAKSRGSKRKREESEHDSCEESDEDVVS